MFPLWHCETGGVHSNKGGCGYVSDVFFFCDFRVYGVKVKGRRCQGKGHGVGGLGGRKHV